MPAEGEASSAHASPSHPCVHHWVVAPPAGPTSLGVCIKCDAERTFSNSEPDETTSDRQRKYKRGGAVTAAQRSEFGAPLRPSTRHVRHVE